MAKDLIEANAPLSPCELEFSPEPVGGDLSILVRSDAPDAHILTTVRWRPGGARNFREATPQTAFELMIHLDQIEMVKYMLKHRFCDAVLDRTISSATRLMKLATENGSMPMVQLLLGMGKIQDTGMVCSQETADVDGTVSTAMSSAASADADVGGEGSLLELSMPDVALLAATSVTCFTSEVFEGVWRPSPRLFSATEAEGEILCPKFL